jgi:hypothetical protein
MAGIERRSQIDTETFKALLVINGGAVVALLGLLTAVLKFPDHLPLYIKRSARRTGHDELSRPSVSPLRL